MRDTFPAVDIFPWPQEQGEERKELISLTGRAGLALSWLRALDSGVG